MLQTIKSRRSIRKFCQVKLEPSILEDIVDCARLAPSAMNLQPVRYILTNDPSVITKALLYLKWAGYVRPRRDPSKDTKPTGLILVAHDKLISNSQYVSYDVGAAVQTILLAAAAKGLGSCWIGAIDREGLKELFDVPENWVIHCVVALGVAQESPVVVEERNGEIKYYLDENDVLYVPKRRLSEVMRWHGNE